jgi:hypothetical protein
LDCLQHGVESFFNSVESRKGGERGFARTRGVHNGAGPGRGGLEIIERDDLLAGRTNRLSDTINRKAGHPGCQSTTALRHVGLDLICIGLGGAAASVGMASIVSVSVTMGARAISIYIAVYVPQSGVPVVRRVIAIIKVRPGTIRPERIVVIGPEREREDVAEEIRPKHGSCPSTPTTPTTAPVITASSTKASGSGKAIPPALIAESISIEAASATKLAATMREATASELSATKPTTTELAATMGEAAAAELSATKPTTTELATAKVTTKAATAKVATTNVAATEMATAKVAATKVAATEVTTAKVATAEMATAKVATAKVTAAEMATAKVAATEMATAKVAATEMATAKVAATEMATAKVAATEMATAKVASTKVAATAEVTPSSPSASPEMPSATAEMPSTTAEMSAATSTMPSAKGYSIVRKRDRDERDTRHQHDDDLA